MSKVDNPKASERAEAHIAAFGKAHPAKCPADHFAKIDRELRKSRNQDPSFAQTLEKIMRGTGIRNYNYNAFTFHEGTERAGEIHQGKAAGTPGPGERRLDTTDYSSPERSVVFDHIAFALSLEAAESCLCQLELNSSFTRADITHVVTTCTSGWVEPGIACYLIKNLGLSLDTQKAELNFNGCFCGSTTLRTARDIIRAGNNTDERRVVLVVATEVASVHYSPEVTDMDSLVAVSLFADGSGAFVLAPEGPWKFVDTGMSIVPDSTELLGMRPHLQSCEPRSSFFMRLSPNVPKALSEYFLEGHGGVLLDKMLALCDDNGEKPDLACHPGGPRILGSLQLALKNRNFPDSALDPSYRTLQENGNMGAAAITHVLQDLLLETKATNIMGLAFGPGVTVEWFVLKKT